MATLNENIKRIVEAKQAIKKAIISKGVKVDDKALLDTYASKIELINIDGGATLDFNALGYDGNSLYIKKRKADIDYSTTIKNKWNSSVAKAGFNSNTQLVFFPKVDGTYIKSMENYFKNCENLVYVPYLNTQFVQNMNSAFENCSDLNTIEYLETSGVTSMVSTFKGCSSIKELPLFKTDNVTSLDYTFKGCGSLKALQPYNFSNVVSMNSTFEDCKSITELPLFLTDKVQSMQGTFMGCSSLKTIPMFDTHSCTDMSKAFYHCDGLTTISPINMENVQDVSSIFGYCKNITSLPLLNFGSVTNIDQFFGDTTEPLAKLREIGGFKDLKIDWVDDYGLVLCPNLTKKSLLNIIDNLWDFRKNGDYTTTRTLRLSSSSFSSLTAKEIDKATAKGWQLSE